MVQPQTHRDMAGWACQTANDIWPLLIHSHPWPGIPTHPSSSENCCCIRFKGDEYRVPGP